MLLESWTIPLMAETSKFTNNSYPNHIEYSRLTNNLFQLETCIASRLRYESSSHAKCLSSYQRVNPALLNTGKCGTLIYDIMLIIDDNTLLQ